MMMIMILTNDQPLLGRLAIRRIVIIVTTRFESTNENDEKILTSQEEEGL